MLGQGRHEYLGVQCYQCGPKSPVLVEQVEQGFAHVSERCMEDLLTMKGKEVPEDDDAGDLHRKTMLSMACIAAIKPAMTDREASACVARRFLKENPDCYADVLVDSDIFKDVLNAGEAAKATEYNVKVATAKSAKEAVLATRDAIVHK